MPDRIFRFGLVSAARGPVEDWTALARRAEELGFSSLLVPDGVAAGPSFLALTAAAAVTERLRLGNFVLPVPLYTAQTIAWEAAALDRLSGGRLELGLGAGRPQAGDDAKLMGVPYGSPGERVRRLGEVITTVEEMFGQDLFEPAQEPRPPIMVAGGGAKLLALAARQADIIGVAADGGDQDLGEKVRRVRDAAGDRFDRIELSTNVFHLGDGEIPAWLRHFGIDPARTADNRNVSVLTGDTAAAIDTLKRRRDEFGISYVTINAVALEQAIPVVEALAGT